VGSPSSSRSPSSLQDQASRPLGWLALDPLWQLDPEQIALDATPASLSSGWRLLLLGDGHTTRNLGILTGQTIEAHVIESLQIEHPQQEQAPLDLAPLGSPLIRRQVWLAPSGSEQPLLYAVSWWNQHRMQISLPDPRQPIGRSLMQHRQESFRELHQIYQGHHPGIADLFHHPGPFLGRHYLLWQTGQPLTLIYEVFSPALSLYLESK